MDLAIAYEKLPYKKQCNITHENIAPVNTYLTCALSSREATVEKSCAKACLPFQTWKWVSIVVTI